MLKVNKFILENFRGIKFNFTIPFYKNGKPTSVVIYGRNGTGKSSIMEAWEWLNKSYIDKLKREGITPNDFPHHACNGDNCYVQVNFVDDDKKIEFVKVEFNKNRITTPKIAGQYSEFKLKDKYPNYLKYSDLQEFVFKSKTQKYEYLTKYFGLEELTKNQNELQTYINKISPKVVNYENEVFKYSSTITKITGKLKFDEQTIVEYINTISQKYNFQKITLFKESKTILSELKKVIDKSTKTKELIDWKNFSENLNSFYSDCLTNYELELLQTSFNELKANEQEITKLILSELYEKAIGLLPDLENKNLCPLCDEEFNGDLFQHIKQKYDELLDLRKKKVEFENQSKIISQKCERINRKLTSLLNEKNSEIRLQYKDYLEYLKLIQESYIHFGELLSKKVTEISELKLTKAKFVEELFANYSLKEKYTSLANKKVMELEQDENTKSLSNDHENLLAIINAYYHYLVFSEKKFFLEDLKEKLEIAFEHLTKFIQDLLQSTFKSLSVNMMKYFLFLENSSSVIKEPQLKLLTGKDKAVELEIEFANEKISPALKILSESQINSFGLSVFLAAIKHFNTEFKFFILDDVVNSFDSFKRSRIADLLSKEFDDFQILLLTHDKIFFDTIQNANPNWHRLKFTSWDYTTGPKYILALNYGEEIKSFLDNDNAISAGQALGRYLEMTLGILNERMETPIRYKIDNIYTLADLFFPYLARCEKKLKNNNEVNIVVKKLKSLGENLIFRNYCVHWKNEEDSFTSLEIGNIYSTWLEIEQIIFCAECSSFVKYEKIKGNEYVRCDCGKLDLKDKKYYQ